MRRMFAIVATLALSVAPARGEVQISGLADVLVRNSDEEDLTNQTFGGMSNLDLARTRVFFDALISDRAQFFAQLLMDQSEFVLYSAYARFQQLGGSPVSMHLGLIPTTVGSFTERAYSDQNPLVGTPLVHNHHSSLLTGTAQRTVADLRATADERSRFGLPIIYDNCWNVGAEIYGSHGRLDYSLGLLSGSLSRPTTTQEKEVPQVTTRLGWYHHAGLVVGVSGFLGPYLFDGLAALDVSEPGGPPAFADPLDYLNGGVGYDLLWSTRYWEIRSESFWTYWEHPSVPTLEAASGYLEAKYKIGPGWYVAGRSEYYHPFDVVDELGNETSWDYRMHRFEYGVGYRPTRRVATKLVAQHNRFDGAPTLSRDHYMVQVSTGF